VELQAKEHAVGGFDYFDFDTDLSFRGIPRNFGGVSGAGLWDVRIYESARTGRVETLNKLEGVAFYRLPIKDNHRTIRCHGQRSIAVAIKYA
jgi:hypothetical protein